MNECPATPCRIACRIGPLVLAAEDPAQPIALAPSPSASAGPDHALDVFRIPLSEIPNPQSEIRNPKSEIPNPQSPIRNPQSAIPNPPDLLLSVERGAPTPRPDLPVVFRHRAGWDVYRRDAAIIAIKAIPYGSDRILRSVQMGLDGGAATLRIAPEDDRPSLPFAYTLSELLILLLTRRSGALLVHGACVELEGRALLFAGASGAGKSTMAALWEKSGRGGVLGDESHLVWTNAENRILVSGTPWPGSSGLFSNRVAPLERFFFLEHGRENAARPLDAADAMTTLLSQSYLPVWDALSVRRVTDLSAQIAARVPSAILAFVPDESAVEFVSVFCSSCLRGKKSTN